MTTHTGELAGRDYERVFAALDGFRIEVPSWGFANTGTRFGKFVQGGAATTIEEKFADAGQVNALTGASPTIALHVLWDMPKGKGDVAEIRRLEKQYGVMAGSINPNLFQDQEYKYGSIANPERGDSGECAGASAGLGGDWAGAGVEGCVAVDCGWVELSGDAERAARIEWMQEVLKLTHDALGDGQRMLVEYKPFEPAFYHTDIADWGMALELARRAGPKAKVLVDTGHHYQGTNIEQIVAWLLHVDALGGFHFNDRKYADDDLTLGSIDPYQVFRIFHEILSASAQERAGIAFMIDQSHNLKGKMEAMVQTVVTAQEIYAKAALVDQREAGGLQQECRLVEAEECFRGAFWTDVRPLVKEWRVARGLPADPLKALAESGYVEKVTARAVEARMRRVASSVA